MKSGASRILDDTVFGLPNNIFGPLTSSARRDYAQILLHLYRRQFATGYADGVDLRKSDLVGFLADAIAQIVPSEISPSPSANNTSVTSDPSAVYRNLLNAGWFIERHTGSETYVFLLRSVMDLLRSLHTIEKGASVNFSGSLQTIEVSLESLRDNPRHRSMMLSVIASQADDFRAKLLAVKADIRANENFIISQTNYADMISAFFQNFVSHLVSDYKAMKTRYNPLRHAISISNLVSEYQNNHVVMEQLVLGYIDGGLADDPVEALALVNSHFDILSKVWASANDTIEDIDNIKFRVEERIARSLRYMDRKVTAQIVEIEDVLELFQSIDNDVFGQDASIISDFMIDDFPIDENSLAKPRVQKSPISSIALKSQDTDPLLTQLAFAKLKYADSLVVNEERLGQYIEKALSLKNMVLFDELPESSPADMFFHTAIRQLSASNFDKLKNLYGVKLADPWIDGFWSTHNGGYLYRKGSSADPEFSIEKAELV